MNWDGNFQAPLAAPARPVESSLGFVYHYNYNHSEGMAFARPAMAAEHLGTKSSQGSHTESKSKKRLSSHQLEMLEGFQEGIKLDPERKTKLSREIGLEPRQVAVWFQNRHAKWKTKQVEPLYDELKQEFDVTCKEKSKVQEEALKLKAILQDRAARKQYAGGSLGMKLSGAASCYHFPAQRVRWDFLIATAPMQPSAFSGQTNSMQSLTLNRETTLDNYLFLRFISMNETVTSPDLRKS